MTNSVSIDAVAPPPAIVAALRQLSLLRADESCAGAPLAGGVSSDIWRIDLATGPVCAKRALAKLRVTADWTAPVERSAFEARWMRHAAAAVPGVTPALLGEAEGCLVMAYLEPARHRLWKAELAAGRIDPGFAAAVGQRLARIHAASAARPALAAEFDSAAIFHAIRMEPYLLAASRVHADRAAALQALVASQSAHRLAVIHGDVSPKNILVGPDGPVFLDAECATWGDPAFDLAFCLTHLLLKCLWVPAGRSDYLQSYDRLATSYLAGVDWEPSAATEQRAARLLPGLLLARVDGKSPVEYINTDVDRAAVRRVGRRLLASPPATLDEVRVAWEQSVSS